MSLQNNPLKINSKAKSKQFILDSDFRSAPAPHAPTYPPMLGFIARFTFHVFFPTSLTILHFNITELKSRLGTHPSTTPPSLSSPILHIPHNRRRHPTGHPKSHEKQHTCIKHNLQPRNPESSHIPNRILLSFLISNPFRFLSFTSVLARTYLPSNRARAQTQPIPQSLQHLTLQKLT